MTKAPRPRAPRRATSSRAPIQRVDTLIVGAGAAGLSAALWLRDFGLDALLIEESPRPGGQLHEIHAPIPNYLATHGWDGARLAGAALADARLAGLSILVGARVTRISARGRWVDRAEDDAGGEARLHARALVLATGLRRRALGVPGEAALAGRGVSHSANRDRNHFAGKRVVVVGGGTAAVEDALLCAEVGSEVTLVHRSSRFRAREDFLERAKADPRIRLVLNAAVTGIEGEESVQGVEIRARGARTSKRIACEGVFVRIGWEPRTELLRDQLGCDKAGYLIAGRSGETSAPWVFAAGDVCSPDCPSIANAVGQGAAVAWEIARRLGRVRG
ncbi:MAG TPA: NAD(P)/FAD-dependent oxidoreductase [Candidatus Eisenbacteria bacterium]|nr:NAD(P)/FAD-dependent oxidoreductase [Candidatus Eisenbacteria bacterium]